MVLADVPGRDPRIGPADGEVLGHVRLRPGGIPGVRRSASVRILRNPPACEHAVRKPLPPADPPVRYNEVGMGDDDQHGHGRHRRLSDEVDPPPGGGAQEARHQGQSHRPVQSRVLLLSAPFGDQAGETVQPPSFPPHHGPGRLQAVQRPVRAPRRGPAASSDLRHHPVQHPIQSREAELRAGYPLPVWRGRVRHHRSRDDLRAGAGRGGATSQGDRREMRAGDDDAYPGRYRLPPDGSAGSHDERRRRVLPRARVGYGSVGEGGGRRHVCVKTLGEEQGGRVGNGSAPVPAQGAGEFVK